MCRSRRDRGRFKGIAALAVLLAALAWMTGFAGSASAEAVTEGAVAENAVLIEYSSDWNGVKVSISGFVRDSTTGNPVGDLWLTLSEEKGTYYTSTSQDGYFEFFVEPPEMPLPEVERWDLAIYELVSSGYVISDGGGIVPSLSVKIEWKWLFTEEVEGLVRQPEFLTVGEEAWFDPVWGVVPVLESSDPEVVEVFGTGLRGVAPGVAWVNVSYGDVVLEWVIEVEEAEPASELELGVSTAWLPAEGGTVDFFVGNWGDLVEEGLTIEIDGETVQNIGMLPPGGEHRFTHYFSAVAGEAEEYEVLLVQTTGEGRAVRGSMIITVGGEPDLGLTADLTALPAAGGTVSFTARNDGGPHEGDLLIEVELTEGERSGDVELDDRYYRYVTGTPNVTELTVTRPTNSLEAPAKTADVTGDYWTFCVENLEPGQSHELPLLFPGATYNKYTVRLMQIVEGTGTSQAELTVTVGTAPGTPGTPTPTPNPGGTPSTPSTPNTPNTPDDDDDDDNGGAIQDPVDIVEELGNVNGQLGGAVTIESPTIGAGTVNTIGNALGIANPQMVRTVPEGAITPKPTPSAALAEGTSVITPAVNVSIPVTAETGNLLSMSMTVNNSAMADATPGWSGLADAEKIQQLTQDIDGQGTVFAYEYVTTPASAPVPLIGAGGILSWEEAFAQGIASFDASGNLTVNYVVAAANGDPTVTGNSLVIPDRQPVAGYITDPAWMLKAEPEKSAETAASGSGSSGCATGTGIAALAGVAICLYKRREQV